MIQHNNHIKLFIDDKIDYTGKELIAYRTKLFSLIMHYAQEIESFNQEELNYFSILINKILDSNLYADKQLHISVNLMHLQDNINQLTGE